MPEPVEHRALRRAPGAAGRGRGLRRCGDEALQHGRDIGADLQAGPGGRQRVRVRIDVDHEAGLVDHAVVDRRGEVEPGAEREHEVRLGQQGLLIGREREAERPQIGGVRARHHPCWRKELNTPTPWASANAASASLAPSKPTISPAIATGRSACAIRSAMARMSSGAGSTARRAGLRRRSLVGLAFGHVFGQRDRDRPRPAVHGNGEGFCRRRRNLVRRVGLEHRLGHRPQHAVVVDLLKGLAAPLIRRDLADEDHERHGILARGVDADGGIGGAGPAGHEGDARLAREPGVGAGGEGGAGFVARDDEAEPLLRRPQRLQHGEVALARHAERGIDAVFEKGRDQRIAAGVGAVRQVPPLRGVRAAHSRRLVFRASIELAMALLR